MPVKGMLTTGGASPSEVHSMGGLSTTSGNEVRALGSGTRDMDELPLRCVGFSTDGEWSTEDLPPSEVESMECFLKNLGVAD